MLREIEIYDILNIWETKAGGLPSLIGGANPPKTYRMI